MTKLIGDYDSIIDVKVMPFFVADKWPDAGRRCPRAR